MNLELWFPQPIWYDDVIADFSEAIKFCKQLQASSPGREISNRGGWQSNDVNIFEHEGLSEVAKIVDAKVSFLANQLNKDAFDNLTFENAWININKKHDSNLRHSHPGVFFSGCVYLQVPEDSGDLIFYRPDTKYLFPMPEKVYDPVLFNNTLYKPRTGMVVLFPAWLEHSVSMSNANEDRISIAFNISINYRSE